MKNMLARVWVKVKLPLFFIIWTAGIIGWMIAIPIYREIENEASAVWEGHLERQLNKDIKDGIGESVKEVSPENPETGSFVPAPKDEIETVSRDEEVKPSSPSLGVEKKIMDVFGEDGKIAVAVAKAESGLVSKRSHKMNSNGTYDWGIMQVNDCHCKRVGENCHEKLLDSDFNIEFAYGIYERSGKTFNAWSTYKSGKYKNYL